ncbi:hypothetical protein DICPUDRAFT_157910 [Dictyostelium purpureum]|uniref:Mitochondrial import inner membrane translocase subunit Tim21 n=1 Tax=Dictyostelium purpureum TaxID=5786 RepID=F1A0B8_DICPU|nr:uncharacterized protein DICPUDRAFT_157910 [Dictyostelium purpureum]EGC30371.1 hypothetical protein DICPUDRAFT_157910 [Dictyostelium purpureum]|eukprot:XP_003293113.1 hypothetical protein DICPUDRAFT_157910 [Dictyostelium purpureum]
MIKITKPILSSILQNQFKFNATQTQQAIRYFSTFQQQNNNSKQSLLNINQNVNIKGYSFFKVSQSGLFGKQQQFRGYSSYSLEDEKKIIKDTKEKEKEKKEEEQKEKGKEKEEEDEEENREKEYKEEDQEVEYDLFGEVENKAPKLTKELKFQSDLIYGVFGFLFFSLSGVAIYNMIEEYRNSSVNPLGMPTYDAILLLQDIYFGELKPSMERGNPDFNTLTKKNYFYDEAGIRNHSSADTTTLIVPIKQKKTRHTLGTVNVDFVKEGDFISIENFCINAINGHHYPLEGPTHKIDTTLERYTGKYSLEELLTDPTIGLNPKN